MSERKAQNKYYPPEWRPEMGSINHYRKFEKARERPKDDRDPVFVIRFEMPFNIWCSGCNNHIGMGVRYNAQKKSIGYYFTTPMYKFRMKCHLCDNHFEIRTDPQNNDYVILSGARRKEQRWDPKSSGAIELMDHKDRNKLESNAMFRLEHTSMDKAKAVSLEPTIKGLQDLKTIWKDDYSINSTLRSTFRKDKAEIKKNKDKESEFKRKHCLSEDLKLAPETTEDLKEVENLELKKKLVDRSLSKMISNASKTSIFKSNKNLTKNLKSKQSIQLLNKILHKH